jgi:hypothetical protein
MKGSGGCRALNGDIELIVDARSVGKDILMQRLLLKKYQKKIIASNTPVEEKYGRSNQSLKMVIVRKHNTYT